MRHEISDHHPLRAYFSTELHDTLTHQVGIRDDRSVEDYLVTMLLNFLHDEGIYAIRDAAGGRVESVTEMVVEGDVRLNASSFDREREVHRHIGDFLLFWSGIFPEYLKVVKSPVSRDALVDVVGQAKTSYHIVSTFDHDPYSDEAPVFRKLSERFEAYQYGLALMRERFRGFEA